MSDIGKWGKSKKFMVDKEKLLGFLLQARTKTYAGSKGKVAPDEDAGRTSAQRKRGEPNKNPNVYWGFYYRDL